MKVAVIGTGVSGLVVAHHLHRQVDLTVYEADARIGGHVNTVRVELEDEAYDVDTGFIVCNDRTYPNLLRLFDELGVAIRPSDMSFSVSDPSTGMEYRASNPATIFAQPRNLVDRRFLRLVAGILKLNRGLRRSLEDGIGPELSLRDLVARLGTPDEVVDRFLTPLGSSIWSADPNTFLDLPAATFTRFAANHGLIDLRGRPQWQTVIGGSTTYVRALTAPFVDRIRTSSPVRSVRRIADASGADPWVEVATATETEAFDQVVIATHPDQALRLLANPTAAEREVLGAIRYQSNIATLHRDRRFLPSAARARAAWNFHMGAGPGDRATLTYWMNLLQGLPAREPLLVTLNRDDEIDPDLVFHRDHYRHPVFDHAAIAAQGRLGEIQGRRGTFFAGAWAGYGFHEDGVRSALDVLKRLAEDSPMPIGVPEVISR